MIKSTLFLLLTITLKDVLSANILVILSMPFYSHQIAHFDILSELSAKGHNLTIFSSYFMDYNQGNVTQYIFDGDIEENRKYSNILECKLNKKSLFLFFLMNVTIAEYKVTKVQLEHPQIRNLFLNSADYQFDLFIYECINCPYMALADIYDCPIVLTLAVDPPNYIQNFIGNSINPSINADVHMLQNMHGQLPFLVRIQSFLLDLFADFAKIFFLKIADFLVYQEFPNIEFPSQVHTANRRAMLYISFTSHTTTSIRATNPFHHQLGYIHLKPPKEILDAKIKNFLDNSSNGVVILSFGSVTTELNDEYYSIFIEAFKELPFNVLWKISSKDSEKFDIPDKIMTTEWLQLSDILAHENVKVLIAHAGLRTIEEAIDREVPMVLIPIHYDQPLNALYQADRKIAAEMDLNQITKESLKEAILEMTKSKYKENIKIIRELAYDRFMSSLELAVENIEHLIKYKETFAFQGYKLQYKYGYISELFHTIFELILK